MTDKKSLKELRNEKLTALAALLEKTGYRVYRVDRDFRHHITVYKDAADGTENEVARITCDPYGYYPLYGSNDYRFVVSVNGLPHRSSWRDSGWGDRRIKKFDSVVALIETHMVLKSAADEKRIKARVAYYEALTQIKKIKDTQTAAVRGAAQRIVDAIIVAEHVDVVPFDVWKIIREKQTSVEAAEARAEELKAAWDALKEGTES